jgi:hypothetical protein
MLAAGVGCPAGAQLLEVLAMAHDHDLIALVELDIAVPGK